MATPFSRGLSEKFLDELRCGRFAGLLHLLTARGLDLQIRHNYINVYAKGQSVLKLEERIQWGDYVATIHPKYLVGAALPDEMPPAGAGRFLATSAFFAAWKAHFDTLIASALPYAGWEGPVEQALIRESMSPGSPVVFLDRQVQAPGTRDRLDLIGLTAEDSPRVLLTEVKQGLDNRIQHLVGQAKRYRDVLAPDGCLRKDVAAAYRRVVEQKKTLGFLAPIVRFPDDPVPVEVLLVLYDYNPKSALLQRLRTEAAAQGFTASIVQVQKGCFALPAETSWERLP